MSVLIHVFPELVRASLTTALVTAESVILAVVVALALAVMRISGNVALDWIARAYIWFWRGVPLIIELFIIYYGLASAHIVSLSAWQAAVLGLGLNTAAYFAEIIRAAILSVDKEQWEAGDMENGRAVTLALVIFPQAGARMLPPMINQLIMTLKNSSLVAFVSVTELFRVGQDIISSTFQDFPIYMGVAACYLIMVTLLTALGDHAEKRLLTLA